MITNIENPLTIYDLGRKVPEEAKRPIQSGRLKGKTDINPMYRIKTLTEMFGPCGYGWKTEIKRTEFRPGANDEIAVFVDINLYYKVGDQWFGPVEGTGGSTFVAKESKGLYTSDECVKMAYTDAISVACKMLGIGADVYWSEDRTKYDRLPADPEGDTKGKTPKASSGESKSETKPATPPKCEECGGNILPCQVGKKKYTANEWAAGTTRTLGKTLCKVCWDKLKKGEKNAG